MFVFKSDILFMCNNNTFYCPLKKNKLLDSLALSQVRICRLQDKNEDSRKAEKKI